MSSSSGLFLGWMLCLVTAVGAVGYEYIVNAHTFRYLLVLKIIELSLICIASLLIVESRNIVDDTAIALSSPKMIMWSVIYVISGITTVIWYIMTKRYGVLVTSTFEFKYVIILAIMAILVGDSELTPRMVTGVGLALIGSWLAVSKG